MKEAQTLFIYAITMQNFCLKGTRNIRKSNWFHHIISKEHCIVLYYSHGTIANKIATFCWKDQLIMIFWINHITKLLHPQNCYIFGHWCLFADVSSDVECIREVSSRHLNRCDSLHMKGVRTAVQALQSPCQLAGIRWEIVMSEVKYSHMSQSFPAISGLLTFIFNNLQYYGTNGPVAHMLPSCSTTVL